MLDARRPRNPRVPLDSLCDRRVLETAYADAYNCLKPRLESQGSDAYLKRQFKHIPAGVLGYIQAKHVVGADPTATGENAHGFPDHLTDVHLGPTTVCPPGRPWTNGMSGSMERTSRVADLPRRRESSSLQSAMHGARSMTWSTPEPHSLRPSQSSTMTTSSGRGRSMNTVAVPHEPWTPVWQTQWDKPAKGGKDPGRKGMRPTPKGGKGKTPKGKGKGQWPDSWAFKDSKGKAFCRDYHLTGTCQGSCGRSHNCPVRQGGWVCNASPDKRTPDECPHASK